MLIKSNLNENILIILGHMTNIVKKDGDSGDDLASYFPQQIE